MWPGTESNCRHEDFQSSALPTELPGHSGEILPKSTGESRFPLNFDEFFALPFDEVDHPTFEMNAVQSVDLLNSRRTGDVYLG